MSALMFFSLLNSTMYLIVAFVTWDWFWIANIAEWHWLQRLLLCFFLTAVNFSAIDASDRS